MSEFKLSPLAEKITERVMWYFSEICKIPRGSGHEEHIANYLEDFAISMADKGILYTKIEKYNEEESKNVHDIIMTKPATKGYEDVDIVILQSHIDMVCVKTTESTHDFSKDEIKTIIEDGYMKADGTTLGADDGIGVACMLAVLESDELSHPAIEALFTSDEEDAMTGALAVEKSMLKGSTLINIDTEKEGEFFNGSAGGINANISFTPEYDDVPDNLDFYKIEISGLKGGHSGVEINNGRANANKLLARTLNYLTNKNINKNCITLYISEFEGGNTKNLITPKAYAVVGIQNQDYSVMVDGIKTCFDIFTNEYQDAEKRDIDDKEEFEIITTKSTNEYTKVFSADTQRKLIELVVLIPNDVLSMYYGKGNLVETSCNLGVLKLDETTGKIKLVSFIRSFIESKKQYVVSQMRILAECFGADFSTDADFPNWQPASKSEIKDRFEKSYHDIFNEDAKTNSIHAGLECGYFASSMPGIDIIAFGPTIKGAHTPKEELEIASVGKITALLIDVLAKMDKDVPPNNTSYFSNSAENSEPHFCKCCR